MSNDLFENLEKLHTTQLGSQRIKKNLDLDVEDVVSWCRQLIQRAENMIQNGKNWYVSVGDIEITVNAHSFTIITAHNRKHLQHRSN